MLLGILLLPLLLLVDSTTADNKRWQPRSLPHVAVERSLESSNASLLTKLAVRGDEGLHATDDLLERRATSCRAGLILYAGKCFYPSRCPTGTFANLDTQRCQTCNTRFTGAQTCTAAGVTGCKAPRYLRLGACVDKCPVGTYIQPGTRNCLGCTGKFSYSLTCTATKILTCRASHLLIDNKCVAPTKCAAGSFLNTTTNKCSACEDSNAVSCSSAKQSLDCKSQYSVVDGTCTLSSCGSRDYLDDGQCLNCEDLVHFSLSCSKAAGATSCGAYTSLWNATCIAYCPPGTYTKDTVCVDCQDDSAVTCNQEGALSCSTSTFLTPNETCTTNCGDGFWGNASNRECETCAEHVATCTNDTTPKTCVDGYKLVKGACELALVTCASNQYLDPNRNICVSCRELDPNGARCDYMEGITACLPGYTLDKTTRGYPCEADLIVT